jgi:hypothetical protein
MYFDIRPSKPDTYNPHKAVDVKFPVEGTNLPNQEVTGKNDSPW